MINNYFLLLIGITISSIFYVLGSYYFRAIDYTKNNFINVYIISCLLGLISFMIKIPIFYYLAKKYTIRVINIFYLIIAFILIVLYSKYVLNEGIPLYTYIIIIIILILIILNNILDNMYKKP
jgi:hypothetical protein